MTYQIKIKNGLVEEFNTMQEAAEAFLKKCKGRNVPNSLWELDGDKVKNVYRVSSSGKVWTLLGKVIYKAS